MGSNVRWFNTVTMRATKYFDKGCKCVSAYYKDKFYYIVEKIGYHGDRYYIPVIQRIRPFRGQPEFYSLNLLFNSFEDGKSYCQTYVFI